MLIDVPDANEVQWEKPASNWEASETHSFQFADSSIAYMAPTFCGAAFWESRGVISASVTRSPDTEN